MLTTSESGRDLYGFSDLRPLLAPSSVAIVGASERPGSFGGQVLGNLASAPNLRLSVVNPKASSVFGVASVPALTDLDGPSDLVAICVPRDAAVEATQQARDLGFGAALVYSSGFAESSDPTGASAQAQLVRIAETGLPLLGPNALGYINAAHRLELHFVTGYGADIRAGGVGVVAQSGALGYLLTQAQHRGLGFAYWASAGNACDVDALDLTNAMLEDPATSCVVLVLESVKDGGRIFDVGRRSAELGKPVIVYKMGDSEQGGRAAESHTGALTGSSVVTRQALLTAGMVVVDHYDELISTAQLFDKCGRANGRGIGVISASGGATIIGADEAELSGVPLPELDPLTVATLEDLLPAFASVGNPADLTAEMVKYVPVFEECLRTFRRDPNLALVLMSLTAASEEITGARAPAITRVAAEPGDVPIGVIWFSEWLDGPGALELESSPDVPFFRSSRIAMVAIRRWLDWSRITQPTTAGTHDGGHDGSATTTTTTTTTATAAAEFVSEVLDGLRANGSADGALRLDEVEGKRALAILGITTTEPVVVDAAALMNAWPALQELVYPAAVKILDRAIVHKANVGGVRLGIGSPQEALGCVLELCTALGDPPEQARAVVESMVDGGGAWFVGARRDTAFGPVLTFGVGGGDVESRTPVLIVGSPSEQEMVRRLDEAPAPIGPMLAARPDLRDQLVAVGVKLLGLFGAIPELSEIDLNPLLEGPDGLVAVDAVLIAGTA